MLVRHFGGRVDPFTSSILVFPLFLVYQVGILSSNGQNGVDFVTRSLVDLAHRDLGNYLVLLCGMLVTYAAIVVILRRLGSLRPRTFGPVLLESSFYALSMGSIILYVMRQVEGFVPGLALATGPIDVLVVSAGAGLHEELIFRVAGVTGLAWLFAGITGPKRAFVAALIVSSVLFSLAHHVGPMSEPFRFATFTYRVLAGAFFAIVYKVRGFAVAAWTHALYDVYVIGLSD